MKLLKKNLYNKINQVLSTLDYPIKDYTLIPPKKSSFGDISSNIALLIGTELKTNPMDCGLKI